jgi:hypothetical protein
MYYLSCDNVGLTNDAIEARRAHEARGERNVLDNLSRTYVTLRDVWKFLVTEHDFYSASGLVRRANATNAKNTTISDEDIDVMSSSMALKLSYGKSDATTPSSSTSRSYGDDNDDDDDGGVGVGGGGGGRGGGERKDVKVLEYANGRISIRIDASPFTFAIAMTTLLSAVVVVVVSAVGGGKTKRR